MSRFGSVMISRAKTEKIDELEKELTSELKQFETAKKQQGLYCYVGCFLNSNGPLLTEDYGKFIHRK